MKKNTLFLLTLLLISGIASSTSLLSAQPNSAADEVNFIYGGTGADRFSYLDPCAANVGNEYRTVVWVTETLFRTDRSDPNYVVRPWLASSYEFENNLTLIVNLRDDVVFHDGTAFNASAVDWNIKRFTHINFDLFGPNFMNFMVPAAIYASSGGENAWIHPNVPGMTPMINSSEVIDEYTIQINMNVPFPESAILDIFATPWLSIISPTAHADDYSTIIDATGTLVGTGPFKFVSHSVANLQDKFVANQEYWEDVPYITNLTVQYYDDPNSLSTAMLAGEVDYTYFMGDAIDEYEASENIDLFRCVDAYGEGYDQLPLNPAYFNVTIREAMNYAYNYDAFISEIKDGESVRHGGAILKGQRFYNASINLPDYNLTRARQVLIDAGVAPAEAATWEDADWTARANDNPFAEYSYFYDASYMYPEYVVAKNSFSAIGIKVVEDAVDAGTYWGTLNNATLRANLELYLIDWAWPLVDPTLMLLYNYWTYGPFNYGFVDDSEINNLAFGVLLTSDDEVRQGMFDRAADKLQNELFSNVYVSQLVPKFALKSIWTGMPCTGGYEYAIADIVLKNPPTDDDGSTDDDDATTIPGYSIAMMGIAFVAALAMLTKRRN